MSLEIPSQRTENDQQQQQFQFAGRKLTARACTRPVPSLERQMQIAELEAAFATGQIALEGLSVTTDLL